MTVMHLRADGLFWRATGGEIVALDADASRYFSANPSAALLWERLSDGASLDDLVSAVCERYDVPRAVAETDVTAFLEQLSERGLLERGEP
jgi:hypothetical protein